MEPIDEETVKKQLKLGSLSREFVESSTIQVDISEEKEEAFRAQEIVKELKKTYKKTSKVINLGFECVLKHLPPQDLIEKYRMIDYSRVDDDVVKVARHYKSQKDAEDYEKYFNSIVIRLCKNVGRFIERSKQKKLMELFVVRSIFRFVCEFLEYKDEKNSKFTTMIVDSRKSMCEGFSDMFVKLCEKANIFALKIHGKSKDLNGNVHKNTGHCWNGVFIENCFFPLDLTWSWGMKRKKFDDFWFLSHPEDFVLTHLPDSDHPQLQFLPQPIIRSQWRGAVFIPIEAQKEGVGVLTHIRKEITFEKKNAVIELKNTKNCRLVMELFSVIDGKVTNQRTIRKITRVNEMYLLYQNSVEHKKTIIEMTFPSKNQDYILKVYKKNPLQPRKFTYLFKYEIRNKTVDKTIFPLLTEFHRKRNCFLISPLEGALVRGKTYEVKILVPGAVGVVLNEGACIKFTTPLYKRSQKEDLFCGKIEFNRMKTNCDIITIFAHFQSMHEDDWMPLVICDVIN
jgi:hypothetical protein